jgi:hypothetical protein
MFLALFIFNTFNLIHTSAYRNSNSLINCISSLSPSARFIQSGDSSYDDYRIGTNFRYDNAYPQVIVDVTSRDDISAAVKCAAKDKLEVVVMNGGHSFEGMSTSNTLLLNLDEYSNIISIEANTTDTFYTVESGIRLARLYGLILNSTSSFFTTGGTCPTVGVTGHILCGGYGFHGRKHGLTSDRIVEFEYVDATGEFQVANASHNSRVFWAMKGSCSSAFGLVVSLKVHLFPLDYPNVTRLLLPDVNFTSTDSTNAIQIALWWQTWASKEVHLNFTTTLTFSKTGVHIEGLHLGSLQSALDESFDDLKEAFAGIFSEEVLLSSYQEMTFLEAVLWFTKYDTLEDLIETKHLPTLEERSHSRRKAKSLFALVPVTEEAVQKIINYRLAGTLNQIEWKAYGGSAATSGSFYTDDLSPLLRGHLFEMHFGNSGGVDSSTDSALVESVNAVATDLAVHFANNTGYIG